MLTRSQTTQLGSKRSRSRVSGPEGAAAAPILSARTANVCMDVMCHTFPAHALQECPPETHRTAEASVPTYLLEVATADVVVSQGAPQLAQLVGEAGKPTTDDGIYIEGLYLVWILGDKVA